VNALGCNRAPARATSGDASVVPHARQRFLDTNGSCTIRDSSGKTTTARWDARSRTFEHLGLYWKLDAKLRVVENGQLDGLWRHLTKYDEHYTVVVFRSVWQGQESVENSYDRKNRYDPTGLLVESEIRHLSGRRYTLSYAREPGVVTEHRRELHQNQLLELWTKTIYQDSLAVERQEKSGDRPISRALVTREPGGRPVRLDVDRGGFGGTDGTPDMRTHWIFDAAGRLTLHKQDGTDELDAPVIDGVWDEERRFEPGCESAAVLPSQLYRIPQWVLGP
jgi:hypothetical protein